MKKTLKGMSALFAAAIMAVSCGTITSFANEPVATAKLSETSGLAGSVVSVELSLDTDNMCTGYNFNVEFDKALELKAINGVFASEVNDNVVTVVNFTGSCFEDNKAVTSFTFEIPADATEGTSYDVSISYVDDFTYSGGSFVDPVVKSGKINVIEGKKAVSNYMVYEYVNENNVTVTEVALRGDVNGDGKVNLQDTISVAKNMLNKNRAAKFNDKQNFYADVNQDGKVDLQDIISLSRYGLASDKNNAWATIIKR